MKGQRTHNDICFIGSRGHFSATVLKALIDHNISISQLIYASFPPTSVTQTRLPIAQPETQGGLEKLAAEYKIPVSYISSTSNLIALDLHQDKKPDYILVACFPYKLPESIINWPKSGSLNIHPSILPKYRGPDPVFWQLYNGENQLGVSLHLITKDIDQGPVVIQKKIPLTNGKTREEIDKSLAALGAHMFIEQLNSDKELHAISSQQNNLHSSYNPLSSNENYIISTNWSAKRAFNFIRGTCSPTGHYLLNTGSENLKIISAIDFSENDIFSDTAPISKEELLIHFSPGILRARVI